jgi:hypothetical protein
MRPATTAASPRATAPTIVADQLPEARGASTAESATNPANPPARSNPATLSPHADQRRPAWAASASRSMTTPTSAPTAGRSAATARGIGRVATCPTIARPNSAPEMAAAIAASRSDGASSRRRLTGAVSSQDAAGRLNPSGPRRRIARKRPPTPSRTSETAASSDAFGWAGQNTRASCLWSMPPTIATKSTTK